MYCNAGQQDRPIQKFVNFPLTFTVSPGDYCDKDGRTDRQRYILNMGKYAISLFHTPFLIMNLPQASPRREIEMS